MSWWWGGRSWRGEQVSFWVLQGHRVPLWGKDTCSRLCCKAVSLKTTVSFSQLAALTPILPYIQEERLAGLSHCSPHKLLSCEVLSRDYGGGTHTRRICGAFKRTLDCAHKHHPSTHSSSGQDRGQKQTCLSLLHKDTLYVMRVSCLPRGTLKGTETFMPGQGCKWGWNATHLLSLGSFSDL